MTWVDLVGVTVDGNTISKSAGTGWGNGGAASGQTISGDGWVEFGAVETNTYRMCGLSDSNPDAHYTSIDYAVYLYNGAVYAFENGTNRGSFGAYQSGDRFRVERTGSTVVYKKNGVVFYTSTVASSGTVMADAAVYTVGGTVADAKMNGVTFGPPNAVDDLTAVAGDGEVTLNWSAPFDNGSSIAGYEVQYGTVSSGLFDNIYSDDAVAGAVVSGLTNGTEYQFRVISSNGYGESAVSNSATATPQVDTSVEVTWVDLVGVTADGNTISKSAGTGWGNGGAASGQTISADGWVEFGAVETNTYRMCGLSDSNPDAHYTSIDYAVYLYNGAVYAFENGTNRGSFGAYQSGDRFRVERTGSTVVYKKNGVVFYTSTVASSGIVMADAAVYTVGGTVADAKMNGVTFGPPNAVDDLTAVAGDGEVTLNWSAPFDNGSSITGYEVQYGTVSSGLFDNIYTDDAVAGAVVSGLTNGTEYQFRVISSNGYGDSAVSNSATATPQVDTSVDVIWVDLVGVTADGNTISKSAGTGWGNGGAASGQTISADGWVEFLAVETNTYRMCGLSDSNVDAHYTSIDYAVYLYNGAVYVFENGTNRGSFGSYQSGDRLRVERTGSTVVYKKNGVVFYTSGVASSGALIADAAIYTVGGTVADAKIGIVVNPPDAVNDLTAVAGSGQITLSWSAPADNGAPISEYEVQYGTVASGLFDIIYTDDVMPGATISGLTSGVEYQFRVVSRNSAGTSGFSNVVTNVPLAVIPVIWRDLDGAAANGNTLTKTSIYSSSWETGGAASAQWFNGDGTVDFLVTQYNTERVCGLSNYNKDSKNTTIGYGIYLNGLGSLFIVENGVSHTITGVYYNINDRLAVERIGTTVTYKKNGVVFYTSTVASTGPLLVDAAIRTTNGVIADVMLRGITAGVPDPVNDLAASGDLGNGEIVLYWKEQPNNGYPVSEYEIQYGTISSGNFEIVYTDNAYPGARITGLTEGVPYQFRVVSRNQMGTSVFSNIATATLWPAPEVDVVWTDLVNVSVDGNSITKTAATFNRMDSGAASQQRVAGDGEILFTAPQTDKSIFCGLSYSNPDTFSSSMLYVVGLSSIGRYSIFESGMSRHISGYYYAGDIFSLERIGTTVTYKHNGVPIYTSSVESVGSFLVDAAIADSGATIADVRIIDHSLGVPEAVDDLSASGNYKQVTLRWSEPADNSDPIQAYEVQYGTTASGVFDNIYADDDVPGAVIAGLTNGVEYQFRVVARNSYGDSDPSNVDTAVPRAELVVNWIDPAGVAVDDNSFVKTSPSFSWDSGAVSETTFNGDGGVTFTIPQTSGSLMAGLSCPNSEMTYQSISYAINTADNGNVYVYESGVSRGGFGVYQPGDQFSVERSGTTIIYRKNSESFYTSIVPANGILQVDSAVYTPGAGISDAVITGFLPGAPDTVTQLHANPGSEEVTLYWEAPANNGAGITNYEIQYGTSASGLFDQTLNAGANQSVVVDNLNNSVEYQFRVMATNVDGSSVPSAPITAIPVVERDVLWMANDSVTVAGNSITKNYGTNSWDTGSAAMARFPGDGGVEFTAAQTNKILACGISSSDTNYNYNEIDYTFYLGAAGDLYIYENGVSRGAFGTYQIGDRLRVERLGNTVVYQLNGSLIYTSSVPSTGTLLVDSALFSANAQIQDATHVGLTWSLPTGVSDLVATPGSGEIQLAWTRTEMAEGYRIYYGTASGVYTDSVDAGAVENFTVTGLAVNTRYYFVVRGYNYMGEGLSSNEVNAIPEENQGTNVYESVTTDTTWTLAGSPYRVMTDISVQAGVTLTIEPGVEVRVRKLHGIAVYGTLIAQGTSAQRILFASYYEDGVDDEIWLGVTFYGQGIISHCEFEGAFEGLIIDNASPTVEYSFFCGYVRIRNGSSSIISHNTFYTSIILQPSLAAPLNPVINDNDFIETGIVMFDIDGLDYSSIVINAENNWWGTADPLQIAEQIIDHNDNPFFVVVDFEPYQQESSRITISNVSVNPLVISHYAGETTNINYSLDHDGAVTVNIVDCQTWQDIRTLIDSASRTAGTHAETWDGRDDTSTPVAYNAYCYTISAVDSQDRYTYYRPAYVEGNADFLNYSITPETFDPYQNEVLTISYDLVVPSWVMMTVNEPRHVQENIYEIDKLVAYQPRNTTNNIETWDGRDENGLILDGEFEIGGWGTILPDNAVILEPDFEITALTTAPYYMFPAYGEVTHIAFALQADAVVNLDILDIEGAPIRSLLADELRAEGTHGDIIWDGKDDVGRIVAPAGNYTVRLTATSVLDNVTQVRYANITIFY